MKIKNIFLQTFAVLIIATLLGTPTFAQNYAVNNMSGFMQKLKKSFSQSVKDHRKTKDNHSKSLFNKIENNSPIDLEELKLTVKEGLSTGEITDMSQYVLMRKCIMHNRNDVLGALLEVGFNPEIDMKFEFESLPAVAVKSNNKDSFGLIFTYTTERTIRVLDDLKNSDPDLMERFLDFAKTFNPENALRFVQTPYENMLKTSQNSN